MIENENVPWLGPLSEVATGLSERAGYTPERALAIATEINGLHDSLREPFKNWWTSGELPDAPEILGYTPRRLIEQGRCRSVPVAFTWLSALFTDPQRAQEHMHSTYDIVSPNPEADLGNGHSVMH